jgi:putative transcriptional regulator
MPIRIRLDAMLMQRRMSLVELADRTGVSAENLAVLKAGEARALRFATLSALCRELGCEPGDLLVYEPGPDVPPQDDL